MSKHIFIIQPDEDPLNPREEWDNLGTMYTWHRNYSFGGKDDESHKDHIEDFYEFVIGKFHVPGTENFEYRYGTLEQFPTAEQEDRKEYLESLEDLPDDGVEELEELTNLYDRYEPIHKAQFERTVDAWVKENLVILPLYLYDHSGITMNTTGFSCRWDSGQVGVIYCTREQADKLGAPWDKVEEQLKVEVEVYDQYITGDVYGIRQMEIPDDYEVPERYRYKGNTYILDYWDDESLCKELLEEFEDDSCWEYFGHKDTLEVAKSEADQLLGGGV